MDISGLVSYEYRPRPGSTTASSRGILPSHVEMNMSSYGPPPIGNVGSLQSGSFQYAQITTGYQPMVSSYGGSYLPASQSQQMPSTANESSGLTNIVEPRPPPAPAPHSTMFKAEDDATYRQASAYYRGGPSSPGERGALSLITPTADPDFATDVDTLMKAIQSRSKALGLPASPGSGMSSPHASEGPTFPHLARQRHFDEGRDGQSPPHEEDRKGKTRYDCDQAGCGKGFSQKTHLEIHMRAHTGLKPFPCKEPTCGQRFSQLGNLRTHERRHTGERPYQCDTCGKRFAQRGNVRAHKVVHEQKKPFVCKLDDCGKEFTQLGNLKSHQNKFHAAALRELTQRFALLREGDDVSPADQELFLYFAKLYKNSNKGIKGRGKDRKIVTASPDGSITYHRLPYHSRDVIRSEIYNQADRYESPTSSHSSHSHHGGYDFNQADVDMDDEHHRPHHHPPPPPLHHHTTERSYMLDQPRYSQPHIRTSMSSYGHATGGDAFADRKLY